MKIKKLEYVEPPEQHECENVQGIVLLRCCNSTLYVSIIGYVWGYVLYMNNGESMHDTLEDAQKRAQEIYEAIIKEGVEE